MDTEQPVDRTSMSRQRHGDAGQVTVLGELEDDRFKAVVTATGDEVVVTFEGRLDEAAAPVVDELLDAVSRWQRRSDRGRSRGSVGRGDDRASAAPAGATLVLDARRIVVDPAGWQVLAGHRERWIREQGPCLALSLAAPAQWSNR